MFSRFPIQSRKGDGIATLSIVTFHELPFAPKRIYWITNMSSMEPRGFHAHKELNQLMCVLNGTINLKLSRGEEVYNFSISAGEPLIYIPKGTWREIYCEQESSSLMVFADDDYHESDYIRDWHEYLSWSKDNI